MAFVFLPTISCNLYLKLNIFLDFQCIEERPNGDRVPLFLGIGETGIRLISITIGGSRNAGIGKGDQQQMTIQDHFE
jgi:hypothetical protein